MGFDEGVSEKDFPKWERARRSIAVVIVLLLSMVMAVILATAL